MKYVILTGGPQYLAEQVNKHLSNGWSLYGSIIIYQGLVLAQAMILPGDNR